MDGLIDCNPNVEVRLIEAFSFLSGVGSAYRIGGTLAVWLDKSGSKACCVGKSAYFLQVISREASRGMKVTLSLENKFRSFQVQT
jgi:hypothetical protein